MKPEEYCPIPQTHQRLHQAHRLWHQTQESYPDPDGFCANLNATIQALRSVTFVLQKEHRAIPGFPEWYAQWQDRLKQDELMKWLVNARNKIEKEGDLKTHSTAQVSILAGGEPIRVAELIVNPLTPPKRIAERYRSLPLPPHIRREGVLRVERQWVAADLPDRELLDILAHCYGVLATLLVDAHRLCGFIMRTFRLDAHEGRPVRTEHLAGRLPCMVTTPEMRIARIHLESGEPLLPAAMSLSLTREQIGAAGEKYKKAREGLTPPSSRDFIESAVYWSEYAKRVLTTDGYHVPLAILMMQDSSIELHELMFEDRQAIYVLMEQLANRVYVSGAVGVILINEGWMARPEELEGGKRPSEVPGRRETLMVEAVAADGRRRAFITPFSRNEKGQIELETTESSDDTQYFSVNLEPIRRVWRAREEMGT